MKLTEAWLQTLSSAGLGALAGWAVASSTNRAARKLAEESGVLRRSKVHLSFLGVNPEQSGTRPSEWCLLHPEQSGEIAFYPLRFEIGNRGDVASEGSVLLVQASQFCIPDPRKLPVHFDKRIKRSVVDLRGFKQISYELPTLFPGSAVAVTDIFTIEPTMMDLSVPVTLKDGAARLSVEIQITYPFSATLLLTDAPSIQLAFELHCIPASTLSEGISRFFKYTAEMNHKQLAGLGPLGRLVVALRPAAKIPVLFAEFTTKRVIDGKGERAYVMEAQEGRPRVRLVTAKFPRVPKRFAKGQRVDAPGIPD